jgi:hypothetical protein
MKKVFRETVTLNTSAGKEGDGGGGGGEPSPLSAAGQIFNDHLTVYSPSWLFLTSHFQGQLRCTIFSVKI